MGKEHCRKLWSYFAVNWKKKGCLFCQKAILPADMQCQDDRKYMHALTDTGDPESDLPISQKAVQSIGLRGKRTEKFSGIKVRLRVRPQTVIKSKRFVQENLFAGSFLPSYTL